MILGGLAMVLGLLANAMGAIPVLGLVAAGLAQATAGDAL
jgi:hypothetical protein